LAHILTTKCIQTHLTFVGCLEDGEILTTKTLQVLQCICH